MSAGQHAWRRLQRCCAVLLLGASALAQSPFVTSLLPRGGQRGTEVVLDCRGRNLTQALGLLDDQPGLDVLAVESAKPDQARLRVAIRPDCPLGQHHLRLRSEGGLGNLKTFWVGTLAEVAEKEPNDRAAQAQAVRLGSVVNGSVRAEDVDWFAVEVHEPMRLSCELLGIRLGDRDWDPWLSLWGPDGQRRVEVDDTALGRMDPVLTLELAQPGTYRLELRDAAFGGGDNAYYRLHVGLFPRPLAIVPAGGRPGETIEATCLGDGPPRRARVELPADRRSHRFFEGDAEAAAPSPLLLSVRDLRNVVEPSAAAAEPIAFEWPAALHGVIAKPGEADRWRFKIDRPQEIEVLVLARRLRSPLDPVLTVRRADGGAAQGNDDQGGPDPYLRYRIQAAGDYEIVVQDHLRRGGELFTYRIEVAPAAALATARVLPPGQFEDHAIVVPKGGAMSALFALSGVPPDSTVEVLGLPPGVQAQAPPTGGTDQLPIVFRATAQAELTGSLLGLRFLPPGGKEAQPIALLQVESLLRVRNNQPYLDTLLERAPLAVSREAPFRIEIEPPRVPILQGSPFKLRLLVTREPQCKEPVRVRLAFVPPGIGAGEVGVGGEKGDLPINANGNAPARGWKIAAVGRIDRNGGRIETCSPFVDLEVQAPWFAVKPGRARAEQGQKVDLVCELSKSRDVRGEVTAELLNLPPGASTAPQKLAKDATKVVFPLDLLADARPGRHAPLLRLRIATAAGEVIQDVYGHELRIDKPLPARTATAKGKT